MQVSFTSKDYSIGPIKDCVSISVSPQLQLWPRSQKKAINALKETLTCNGYNDVHAAPEVSSPSPPLLPSKWT